jgi:hypothetical protein
MIYKFPRTIAAGAHFLFADNRLEKFNLDELESVGPGATLDFSGNKFSAEETAALVRKLAELDWRDGVLNLSGSPIADGAAAAIEKLQENGVTILHS